MALNRSVVLGGIGFTAILTTLFFGLYPILINWRHLALATFITSGSYIILVGGSYGLFCLTQLAKQSLNKGFSSITPPSSSSSRRARSLPSPSRSPFTPQFSTYKSATTSKKNRHHSLPIPLQKKNPRKRR